MDYQHEIIINQAIYDIKYKLNKSDYKILKYIEGELDEGEYFQIKKQRQEWRNKINQLEEELNLKEIL